jgi:abortive infection bacteriophage resistance protein
MMDIGGTHSISDPSDIHSKPIEIQIKKSSSGNELNEVHYYSLSGYNPTTRASISDDSVLRKNRDSAVYDAFVKIE